MWHPLVVIAILGLSAPAAAQTVDADAPIEPLVIARGVGQAFGEPDAVQIVIGVRTEASTAAEAAAENSRLQNAVIAVLLAEGIAADSIQTSSFAVRPNWSPTPARVESYVVDNTVQIRTRNVGELGRLIDVALAAGANRIERVVFSSSKQDSLRRTALEKAVEAARLDAEVMARAGGGRLGQLVQLSNTSPSFGPADARVVVEQRRVAAGSLGATSIAPQDVTVTAAVTATWKLVRQ